MQQIKLERENVTGNEMCADCVAAFHAISLHLWELSV